MRIAFVIISWVLELCTLGKWFGCWHFKEMFSFTPSILTIRLIEAINDDKGVAFPLIRVLHNKVTYFFWGGAQTFLQYWDARFLKEFIGIIGCVGIYLALWYLITKKRRAWYLWTVIVIYSIFAFVEMFILPDFKFSLKLFAFGLPLQFLSLYGIWYFLRKKSWQRYLFIIILLVISLLSFIIFPLTYQNLCLKI